MHFDSSCLFLSSGNQGSEYRTGHGTVFGIGMVRTGTSVVPSTVPDFLLLINITLKNYMFS